eukprot:TRINITY_DN14264_c0_g2_i1.p1 TRINITY_DN14264_c0_g2~~TRINITY_DN14264_c0_g2_i1.p1  ORF type:complete len:395 (-),score=58.56 TRINITY_DN14264_c0_g2_i1:106-1224(-)
MALADDSLQDPWSLVRLAMGSLAGESWRLKQALAEPQQAWTLRQLPRGSTWWDQYKQTQTFDEFKLALPFRPNTMTAVQVVLVGDEEDLQQRLHLEKILRHVEEFIGLRVEFLTDRPQLRLSAAGLRKSADDVEQVGGHFVLAFLQGILDPRSVCTLALTSVDLYPPQMYDFVTGMVDVTDRVGLYSTARYFKYQDSSATSQTQEEQASLVEEPQDAPSEDQVSATDSRTNSTVIQEVSKSSAEEETQMKLKLSVTFVKVLVRETLKLCGAKECTLLSCLMNPLPETENSGLQPEVVNLLPLSLCCICLRKLHWLNQSDLLDRYGKLPPVLSGWFWEETRWLWMRQKQVGMPTSVCLSNPKPLESKFKIGRD